MIKVPIIMLLLATIMQVAGMEKPRAKRRLFQEEENKDMISLPVIGSPKSGYGTAPDTGSPVKRKESLARMGITDVSINNRSGKPALVSYLGSAGQSYRLLEDFNKTDNKAAAHLSALMNLVKGELYITAPPELFHVAVTADGKKIQAKKMLAASGNFGFWGELPNQAAGKLTIKITPGTDHTEPVRLNMQYE